MINIVDESYKKNVCKKISQLTRVIYAMESQKEEREFEKKIIHQEFENVLSEFLDEYKDCLKNIFNSLVRYRKKCLQNSCIEIGGHYKQLKNEYFSFLSQKNQEFQNILQDAKSIQEDIINYENEALSKAAQFIEYSDFVLKEITLHSKKDISQDEIDKATHDVSIKIEKFEKQWNEQARRIKKEYEDKMSNEKSIGQKEVELISKQYYINNKDAIEHLQSTALMLKNEIDEMKMKFENEQSAARIRKNNYQEKRHRMVEETKQILKVLERQYKILGIQLSTSNKVSNNIRDIENLQKQRLKNYNDFQSKNGALQNESYLFKHKRHDIQRSFKTIQPAMKNELEKRKVIMSQQYVKDRDKILGFQAQNRKSLNTALLDMQRIFSFLDQLIKKSISNENSNASKMRLKLEQIKLSQQVMCESIKRMYMNLLNQKNDSIFQKIENIYIQDISEEEKVIGDLKSAINTQIQSNIEEINSVKLKEATNYENYKKQSEERIKKRSDDNIIILQRKKNVQEKSLNQLKDRNKNELENAESKIKESNQLKLSDFRDQERVPYILPEISEYEAFKNKKIAKMNYFDQAIIQANIIADKKCKCLDQEIKRIDKQMRQYQRYVKNSIQQIDEDFELKIQIRSVDLDHKIENLSKLFTKEENERGVDIIDAIRKVREAKNRTINFFLRKRRENEEMLNSIQQKINEKKQIINDYNNGKYEDNIKHIIDEKKNEMNQMIINETNKTQIEKDKIYKEMQNVRSETNLKLQVISDEKGCEIQEFNKDTEDIQNEIQKILDNGEKQKIEIDDKIKVQIQEYNAQYENDVKALQKRIAFAKKIYNEEAESCKLEREKIIEKYNKEMNDRKQNLESRAITARAAEIDIKLSEVIEKQSNLHQQYLFNSEESAEIKNKRLQLEKLAILKTTKLGNEFEKHYNNIREVPQKAKDMVKPNEIAPSKSVSSEMETFKKAAKAFAARRKSNYPKTSRVFPQNKVRESSLRKGPHYITPHIAT